MGNYSGSNYSDVDPNENMKNDNYVVCNSSHWVGPYNVLVPNYITSVVASDGGNRRFKDGGETEMGIFLDPPMDAKTYRERYATKGDDGKYYYKEIVTHNLPTMVKCGTTVGGSKHAIDISCEDNGNNDGYWNGPYGVLVSNDINSVVADDGYNSQDKYGGVTEMFMKNAPKMNEEIYKQTYAKKGDDGKYYYVIKDKVEPKQSTEIDYRCRCTFKPITNNNYWNGPYGVLVPNDIEYVVASDGGNTRYKSGGETEMGVFLNPPMNAEIYKEKYATLGQDGKYYYKK